MLQGYENVSQVIEAPPLDYYIGREGRRFWLFGRRIIKWRAVTRGQFYHALRETELLAQGADTAACDVMLLAGTHFEVGPYTFKGARK